MDGRARRWNFSGWGSHASRWRNGEAAILPQPPFRRIAIKIKAPKYKSICLLEFPNNTLRPAIRLTLAGDVKRIAHLESVPEEKMRRIDLVIFELIHGLWAAINLLVTSKRAEKEPLQLPDS